MKKNIHQDLLIAKKYAYEKHNLHIEKLTCETESKEYGACSFEINDKIIKFRVAKITPTKIGQFVTLWKRIGLGPIMPYDQSDLIDLFVISVRNEKYFGQFVFPQDVLLQKGFISKDGMGGKRAMRVYPPWDIPENQQAQKTQAWQLLYFFEIQPLINDTKMKKLFF